MLNCDLYYTPVPMTHFLSPKVTPCWVSPLMGAISIHALRSVEVCAVEEWGFYSVKCRTVSVPVLRELCQLGQDALPEQGCSSSSWVLSTPSQEWLEQGGPPVFSVEEC